MNRNNFWIHFGIAVVVITLAAVLGQIRRWQSAPKLQQVTKQTKATPKPIAVKRSSADGEPEVNVRFRPK